MSMRNFIGRIPTVSSSARKAAYCRASSISSASMYGCALCDCFFCFSVRLRAQVSAKTGNRSPRLHGFPQQTSGSTVMRSSFMFFTLLTHICSATLRDSYRYIIPFFPTVCTANKNRALYLFFLKIAE